jgi:hypothetical protein
MLRQAQACLQVLFGVNQRLRIEDVDSPLVSVRPVKNVLLVVVTGDRGLCGGYNNFVLKKVRQRQPFESRTWDLERQRHLNVSASLKKRGRGEALGTARVGSACAVSRARDQVVTADHCRQVPTERTESGMESAQGLAVCDRVTSQ